MPVTESSTPARTAQVAGTASGIGRSIAELEANSIAIDILVSCAGVQPQPAIPVNGGAHMP